MEDPAQPILHFDVVVKTTITGDVDDRRVNPGIAAHVTDGVKSRWRARLPARGRARRR
jgi:hypothetical protein